MKKIIFIALCLFAVMGLYAEPQWYANKNASSYSLDEYFVGAGSGSDEATAVNNAKLEIASQISVTIESKLDNYMQSIETESKASYKESLTKSTTATVNQTIQGIQIVEKRQEGKTFYVMGVVNKAKYLSGLKVELDKLWSSISNLTTSARKLAKDGKIIAALDNYTDAQEFINSFYTKKALYDALSNNTYKIEETITIQTLISEIREVLSDITLTVVNGDKQKGKAGMTLPAPITVSASYKAGGTKVNLAKMPLTYYNEDNTIIAKTQTADNGEAEVFVTALASSSGTGKVIIKLSFNRLPALYAKYVQDTQVTAGYELSTNTPIAFAVIAKDKKGVSLPKLEAKIVRVINKLNYNVDPNSPFIIEAVANVSQSKEVEGFSGNNTMVEVELSIVLKVKAGETLGSMTAKGQGLSDKGEEKATDLAYTKANISETEFNKMIAGAEAKLQSALLKTSIAALKNGKLLYTQNKLEAAIEELAKVMADDKNVAEASSLITEIQIKINQRNSDKQQKEADDKEKQRQFELEKARIDASKVTLNQTNIINPTVTVKETTVIKEKTEVTRPVEVQRSEPMAPPTEDRHFIQPDDYFIGDHGLDDNTYVSVRVAKMTQAPGPQTNGEAEFFRINDGNSLWTKYYWRSRAADVSELKLGTVIMSFDYCEGDIYIAPKSKEEARNNYSWFISKVTDLSSLYKGYITVSGGYKIHKDNIRVIVK